MKYVTFSNGVEMPILGLGVYDFWDLNQCEETVLKAIQHGYRLIDTAEMYRNEEAVGNAILKSGIDRKEMFITTKVWFTDDYYHYYEKVINTVNESLKKLQTDYIDLVLLHSSFSDYYSGWRALEDLYNQGKIRAIGVSNFPVDKLMDLTFTAKISPMINQIEMHPLYQRWEIQEWSDKFNIVTESWASLARANKTVFNDPTLLAIAKEHNKTVAQVILRWLIQRGVVVIPKSVHEDRLIENFDVFDFELTEANMSDIAKLDQNWPLFWNMDAPETTILFHHPELFRRFLDEMTDEEKVRHPELLKEWLNKNLK